MSQTIYQPLRSAVWNGLHDADRYIRYYSRLAERYRRWHQIPRMLMAIAALGVAFQDILGEWVQQFFAPGASLFLVAAVMWDLLSNHGKKAAILDAVCVECGECELLLRNLWISIEQALAEGEPLDVKTIQTELKNIETDMDRITARVSFAGINVDDRLNERMMAETNEVLTTRFHAWEAQ